MTKSKNTSDPATISGMPERYIWIIHVILWIVLLVFPFLFANRDGEVNIPDYLRFLTVLTGIMIVFYVNYLYLVKRFIFSRRMWQFVVVNLLLFIVMMVVSHFIMEMIQANDRPMRPGPQGRRHVFIAFMFFDFVKYLFVAALSVALKMTSEWYKTEHKRKELEKMHSEAELQNLKSQLNPHFLFNTLNNIYSLIAISSERAQEAVHVLSKLLRYILYDSSQPFVPVERDIDFVHNYIELMRIRLPNHAELKTDIQVSSLGVPIAPLLFISLIENAFKHGVSNNKPSFIDICITSDNEHIKCSIRNSYFPKNEDDDSGSGIGIVNLRRRLDLLYPNSYNFICERDGDIYISELAITL